MVTLLFGENSYEREAALERISANFSGQSERIDSSDLALSNLVDLLMGQSLFSDKRLVVVRDLASNRPVWDALADWLDKVSDDIIFILVEEKLDKRTKTYKALKSLASVQEFTPWTERDSVKAEQWVIEQAPSYGLSLPAAQARQLVDRVGVDQWQLSQGLAKLELYGEVSANAINQVVDANPSASVFALLETALRGDQKRLQELIRVLETEQDPYQTLGLLASQAIQLMALVAAEPGDNVASDFGAHPYAISRLKPLAARQDAAGARRIVQTLAAVDTQMKSSSVAPWLLLEQALLKIAQ